jgi:hypothetical protein
MAHYAQIDSNNFVTNVIVVANEFAMTEIMGQEFIASIGLEGTWIQTSYNTFGGKHINNGIPLRKNYAGIGMNYDPIRDAFLYPQPYPSYVLNEETCLWENPIPKPPATTTTDWKWNEETLSWIEFTLPIVM